VDISFVVDHSGSIKYHNPPNTTNWKLIIDFMVNLVMEINVAEDATHVGAVSFGELSKLYIPVFQSAKA